MESSRDLGQVVQLLCTLDDGVRRACYQRVRHATGPITRADVAASVGITTRLAAFHLDKLVDVGLLEADYLRTSGRGRGGGRPAKRYRPSEVTLDVTIPPRRYDVIGIVLAEAACGADRAEVGERVGREIGRSRPHGTARDRIIGGLTTLGFEPNDSIDATIVQRNCPFAAVQRVAPQLVCDVNYSVVRGLLDSVGAASSHRAELAPSAGRCCVLIHAS
jgi:predicted ArsR family transcriptional regulator